MFSVSTDKYPEETFQLQVWESQSSDELGSHRKSSASSFTGC